MKKDDTFPKEGIKFLIQHHLDGLDHEDDKHPIARFVKRGNGWQTDEIESVQQEDTQYFKTDKLTNFCFLGATGDICCPDVLETNICFTRKKVQTCTGSHLVSIYGVSKLQLAQFEEDMKKNNE